MVLFPFHKSDSTLPSTDADLMERLTQRDSSALDALYDRYALPVYSLVLRISRQSASAEEIVQDVFLLIWRNAAQYRVSHGPLRPWLFTLARNRALDQVSRKHERQRRREVSYDLDFPDVAGAPNPELSVDDALLAARVRDCMGELPEPQRHAIELAFFQGMTHTEIATALSEPLGTVKNRIRSGLIRLRETLRSDTAARKGQECPPANNCELDIEVRCRTT